MHTLNTIIMSNCEIKTFKKATSKEFAKMTVQERKDYLNRYYFFLHPIDENNNLKEGVKSK